MGVWWLRKHTCSTGERATHCPACTQRWHSHGADPACFLTFSQLSAAVFRSALVRSEVVEEHGKLKAVQHKRPHFFDEGRVPVLDEAQHAHVMRCAYGGRVDTLHDLFELDSAPTCPHCGGATQRFTSPFEFHMCAACKSQVEPTQHDEWEIKLLDISSLYPGVAKLNLPADCGTWVNPSEWSDACVLTRETTLCMAGDPVNPKDKVHIMAMMQQ